MVPVNSYHACFDVKYYDEFAIVGYVLFVNHLSSVPSRTGQVRHDRIEPYVSGEFYKRELPCVLSAINQIQESISLIYVDGNVWLGDDRKGLGFYVYEALHAKIPVIGISKTSFHNSQNNVVPVTRQNSVKPLYVSSVGIDLTEATSIVEEMNGVFRIPSMIKLADSLSKQEFES